MTATPDKYDPALVERAMALVRRVAASEPFWVEEVEHEARAIVADLPAEVDGDEFLIEAEEKKISDEYGWNRTAIRAAIKRGRELAGEGK